MHRRGSGEYGRKRKGTSSGLDRTIVEVVQLSRTQEKETNQKMDKAERFLRSTGAQGKGDTKGIKKEKKVNEVYRRL